MPCKSSFLWIQWLHHKEIVSIHTFTKICLMSVHNVFMSDQTFINQLCERSDVSLWAIKNIFMIAHILVLSAHRGFFYPISFIMPCKSSFPYIQWLHHQGIVSINTFTKICLMSVHIFPVSDQKHSYDRSHSCSERSQRVLLSNFFHHALQIYFPHIQWFHHKGNVSIQTFTKVCLMSVHNMFMSDQMLINQPFEWSYISLWAIKNILMIAHIVVLSAHRGFFVQFLSSCPGNIFSLYPAFTTQRNCKYSTIYKTMPYERSYISLWAIKNTLMIVHTLVLSAHRGIFLANFFHHALEIYFPHILSDFMLKNTIIGYLEFFLMTAHKMWPLTTYNLDMFIPTSWGNIVPVW